MGVRGLTILIDMDDTIENLCETWVNFLAKKYKLKTTINDITQWDMCRNFPSLTPDEIFKPLETEEFWRQVRPIEGAIDCIKRLFDDGHEIYIVTASHPNTVPLKMNNVLFKYFPFIDASHIIITANKQMVMGDVMIDDAPHNLIGANVVKILFSAPHNRDFDARKWGMYRADNWAEIYQYISKL